MIKLKPRLAEIVKFIAPSITDTLPSTVCDIGTDHGHIPIWLIQNGIQRVIATDISAPSANKARLNALAHGLTEYIDVRVGYGLDPLKTGEADTVIIAGMGGILISEILASGAEKSGAKVFILQPMGAVYELRTWLQNNGYVITHESIARERDKLYNVLRVVIGDSAPQTQTELYIGKQLIKCKHPLLPLLIDRELFTLSKKITALTSAGYPVDDATMEIYNDLKRYKDVNS